MTDPYFFDEPNDLDSMINNLPDQTPEETYSYDPTWDATPEVPGDDYHDAQTHDQDFTKPASDSDQVSESSEPALPEISEVDPMDMQDVEFVQPVYTSPVEDEGYVAPAEVPQDQQGPVEEIPTEEVLAETDPVIDDEDPWANYVDDGVYGNAYAWQNDWYWQGETSYCGPTSVSFILNQFYGANISDPTILVQQGLELGIDNTYEDGTTCPQIEQLLEANGVSAEWTHANSTDPMLDLAAQLEEGRGVIAVVDAEEIWASTDESAIVEVNYDDASPDHALVVSEINVNTGMVTFTDPGDINGNGLQVDFETFQSAWADSDFEMVKTDGVNGELRDPSLQPVGADFTIVNATGNEQF